MNSPRLCILSILTCAPNVDHRTSRDQAVLTQGMLARAVQPSEVSAPLSCACNAGPVPTVAWLAALFLPDVRKMRRKSKGQRIGRQGDDRGCCSRPMSADPVTEHAVQHGGDRPRSDRACVEQGEGAFGPLGRRECRNYSVARAERAESRSQSRQRPRVWLTGRPNDARRNSSSPR